MVGLIAFGKTASALAAFVKTGDVYCTEVQSVLTVQEDIEAILQEEYYKFNWDNDLQPAKDAWSEGTENTPVLLAAPLARETAEQDPKTIKLLETMTERYNLVIISAVLGQKDSEYALPAARAFREKGVKVCMVACFPPKTAPEKERETAQVQKAQIEREFDRSILDLEEIRRRNLENEVPDLEKVLMDDHTLAKVSMRERIIGELALHRLAPARRLILLTEESAYLVSDYKMEPDESLVHIYARGEGAAIAEERIPGKLRSQQAVLPAGIVAGRNFFALAEKSMMNSLENNRVILEKLIARYEQVDLVVSVSMLANGRCMVEYMDFLIALCETQNVNLRILCAPAFYEKRKQEPERMLRHHLKEQGLEVVWLEKPQQKLTLGELCGREIPKKVVWQLEQWRL
ncbi:hypothetical protein Ruko_09560 [Ruthenibacterium sp. TH_2024_36131]|uniref:hypothetical protein n=1 Tax=Owariibacterium komagatae TaxID=3136601 RepID=UPI0038B2785E